jgi:leader peptidase (prepilin peptidase)/N-methyltransferase
VGIAGILLAGRDREMPIAFGPFLASAGWIAFVWGDSILSGYLRLFNF